MSAAVEPPAVDDRASEHWTARHAKPVIFVIVTLVAVGIYLASTIPAVTHGRSLGPLASDE